MFDSNNVKRTITESGIRTLEIGHDKWQSEIGHRHWSPKLEMLMHLRIIRSLIVNGSWLMVGGSAPSHEPGAMSHQPFIIDYLIQYLLRLHLFFFESTPCAIRAASGGLLLSKTVCFSTGSVNTFSMVICSDFSLIAPERTLIIKRTNNRATNTRNGFRLIPGCF